MKTKGGEEMKVPKSEQKEIRDRVDKILAQQGISYDDWIHERHKSFVSENLEYLFKILVEKDKTISKQDKELQALKSQNQAEKQVN